MVTSSRDAKLILSVESLGQDNISKLEKSLRDLAATGDASAAGFGDLADEISRLGGQNDALQAVKTLAADTDELNDKQAQAAATAKTLADSLELLRAATAQAKAAQEAARAELVRGNAEYTEAGNALRTLKAEYDAAGKNTAEYRSRLQQLTAEQNRANLALVTLRENNRQANDAVREATAEQGKAEGAYKRASAQLNAASAAVDAHNKAMAVAGAEARKLGVDINDLADAETTLITTFSQAATAAERRKQALEDMAEADRLAAREAETMAALVKRGEAALWAEEAALREAAKGAQAYAEAKAKAAADDAAWQREADQIVSMVHAQQASTKATEAMIRKLRELEARKAFEKQAEDAQRMVRETAEAAREAERYAKRLGDLEFAFSAAEREAKALSDAFGQINVRPIEQVQQEIESTNAAMATLAASGKLTGGALAVAMTQGQTKVQALERELRSLNGTLTRTDKLADLLKNSMGQITAGNLIADGIGYLVNQVKEMGRAFVVAVVELDQMRRGLNAIYKDAKVTASQIDFLRKASKDAGVSIGSLSGEFVRFSASMKSANVPIEQSNALFASLTKAAASLGLNAEAVAGSLNALGQMASKGTVSLEELRQQLGDRLPGALGLTAKGFGISEAELIKLVESGQLATRDFIVPFTQALTTMHGETTGIISAWNDFKNVLTNTSQTVGDAGGVDAMVTTLKALKLIVGTVATAISGLFVVIAAAGKGLGVLTAAFVTMTNPMTALAEISTSLMASFAELGQSFKESIGLADRQAASTDRLRERVSLAADETKNLTQAEKTRLLGTRLLSVATEDMSAALVQYQVASAKALSEQVKLTEALGKEAKAIKDQGDAKVRITKLSGDAAAATKAEAEAATAYAAALAKEAASKQEELKLIAQEIEFTKANAEARKLDAKAVEDQLVKLREKQVTTTAETMQAAEAAEAARAMALQRRLEAEATGDQSAKLADLREEMVRMQGEYAVYEQLLKEGLVREEDVMTAREKLAAITYKVRDGERDRAENAQLLISAMTAENDLAKAALELEMAVLKAAESKARADGNEYELRKILIQQKELEIKLLRLTVDAKIAESEATIANLNVKKSEIALDDPLRAARIAAIDLSIKAAEADILRAKAAGESVAAQERELKALKDGTAARREATTTIQGESGARGRATAATNAQSDAMEELYMKYKLQAEYSERQIELLNKEAEAAERAAEAYRKKWNIDKDGFTLNSNGQRMQQSQPTERYVYDTAKSQGLTDEQAINLVDQFMRNGQPTGWQGASGILGGSKDWFSVVNEAINKQVMDNARNQVKNQTAPDSSGQSTSGSGTQTPGKTVNVNIGGRSTRVNVASDADANNLVAVLRQLENDGSTAS